MIDIFKIKFEGDLVGRGQRIDPFDVAVGNQNQLRAEILKRVRPKLLSREVDLVLSMTDEGLTGIVVVGMIGRPVGQFKVIQTEGNKE
jgi:hypothetical protein